MESRPRQSLVHELVRDALDPNTKVSDLLRKALVIAIRLSVTNSTEWITKELEGYSEKDKVPVYRIVSGKIEARNHQGQWIPYVFLNLKTSEVMSKRGIGQSIGELEHLLQDGINQSVCISYPAKTLNALNSENIKDGIVPVLVVNKFSVKGIVDGVRTSILKWALKLEADKILGEGQSFSVEEKDKASQNIYNIGSFTGVLGNVTAQNSIIGDYASIHEELKRLGVPQKERNELENIMDGLKDPDSTEEKDSLISRGSAWLIRNGPGIGYLADKLRPLFESMGSS